MNRARYRRLIELHREQQITMIALRKEHRMDVEYSAIIGNDFQALLRSNLGESHDPHNGLLVIGYKPVLVAEATKTT